MPQSIVHSYGFVSNNCNIVNSVDSFLQIGRRKITKSKEQGRDSTCNVFASICYNSFAKALPF